MKKFNGHVADYLKSLGQAFFLRDAYFGAALLVVLGYFYRPSFACALLASLIGYFHSIRNSTPKLLRDSGLIPINCFFFGLAMAFLFQESPWLYAFVAAGALTIPLVTKASFEILQHWKVSPFIFPYILTTWAMWLCGSDLPLTAHLHALPGTLRNLPPVHPGWNLTQRVVWSAAESIGRLLFVPDAAFGASVLLLVTLFSPRRGLFFLFGTIIGTAAAYLATSESSVAWEYGYLSYCSGLIGLGLASFPEKFSARMIGSFCVISAFLTLSMDRLLSSAELPMLSLPYVLTLWLALLSRVPRVSISWAKKEPLYTPIARAELEEPRKVA